MADFTAWDWFWWLLGFVVMPIALFTWNQWQAHKTYSEMRKRVDLIGSAPECLSQRCSHPEHPMICLECGCDWMTDPSDERQQPPAGQEGRG